MEIQHRAQVLAREPRHFRGSVIAHISLMPNQHEQPAENRTTFRELAIALGVVGLAIAGGIGIVFAVRRLNRTDEDITQFEYPPATEQAVTINASLEAVEAAWVEWCAEGQLKLKHAHAVRFEPAPGARGTQVHLVGGRSAGAMREVLRQFKQRLETGEVSTSDGPGLSRPAQPRDTGRAKAVTEVER
jgi:hypothetical protein